MSMQLTQSMEVSILNILSIHPWTWLLLFSFTHFCSNLQFFPPPHIGKSALFSPHFFPSSFWWSLRYFSSIWSFSGAYR